MSQGPFINEGVPGAYQYFPLNDPEIGTALPAETFPQNAKLPILFQPVTYKGVTFKNRIWVSPMCMYSSDDGHATDFHLVHIGNFAIRGAGAICLEATAVLPEGRISPQDAGLWTDTQIAPLKRIVDFAHAHGTRIGVQLAHAGRKASTHAPWIRQNAARTKPHPPSSTVAENEGGWPKNVYGPSTIPFSNSFPKPKESTKEYIQEVEDAFIAAVERCKEIGFDFIDVHAAHGYLFHEFVSPLSNTRTDEFGGSFENRLRFPLQVISRVRKAWADKPLFVRISASDWADGPEKGEDGEWKQWGIEQSKIYVAELKKLGVDLIDVSSGGNWEEQKIVTGPGYQVHFAEAIKKEHPDIGISAVGLITEPQQAETYLQEGKADVIFLARELLRTPDWPLRAAEKLGVAIKPANQYERAWADLLRPRTAT